MPSLSERLEAARRQQFVGRSDEREVYREALLAREPPFVLLYIFGPGGVGKTSLLREYGHMAAQAGLQVLQLDGRNIEATPDSFMAAVQQTLGLPAGVSVFEALAQGNGRAAEHTPSRLVLLLDTAELLTPLDSWLRDLFLPQLPDNVLTVLAGRNPPSLRWRTDPGWQTMMRVVPLHNLSQPESRAYLMRRQIPAVEHEKVLQFTHGHPLALSLVADVYAQQPDTHFQPEEVPDMIKTLLEQFMQEVPSPHHRAALEACSQVRLLNEPLLGAMVPVADPHPLFEWLRGLSFIDSDRRGLFPHDLAREALAADLRWRDPLSRAELHSRARSYYIARFRGGNARDQRRVLNDYIFLHRENPVIWPYFEWQSTGVVFTDSFRPQDEAALLAMVRAHEGEAAAHIAAYWLARQPHNVAVLRQAGGEPQGFLLMVSLGETTAADGELDPAVRAVWEYLARQMSLEAGEVATLFRFWMARETYQAVSPVQSRIFLNIVQHYLTVPGLAFTFIPCAEPDFWTAVFAFADLQRLPEADFSVAGRHFGVYGHNWRTTPPLLWLANMAEHELGGRVADQAALTTLESLPELDEESFRAAVRDALHDFTDGLALQRSPLLQTRLVGQRVGKQAALSERVEAVRQMLQATAVDLQNNPRQVKLYRALYHTYFQPAPTQEKAAELLDIPFSSYRRHLRAGIEYVTERLWQQEVGG